MARLVLNCDGVDLVMHELVGDVITIRTRRYANKKCDRCALIEKSGLRSGFCFHPLNSGEDALLEARRRCRDIFAFCDPLRPRGKPLVQS